MLTEGENPILHKPVLLDAVMRFLITDPAGCYVDATFGRGGHSQCILAALDNDGHLLAIDKDPEAIRYAKTNIPDKRFDIEYNSFANIDKLVAMRNWTGKVSGVLLDLGLSSPQIDEAERGFSFAKEGPLDMRMNPESSPSASEWLAMVSEKEMVKVFQEFGEERFAKRIAAHIVKKRTEMPITTTQQLVEIIKAAVPFYERNKHPATRVFQAIRIAVNNELTDLSLFLQKVMSVLKVGGRLVIISFHSLEDRLVKHFMLDKSRPKPLPKNLPIKDDNWAPTLKIITKPIKPTLDEVAENVRARSAIMRVAEKIA